MYASVGTMPVKFALRKIVARENVKRGDAGRAPLTQMEIASGSGVSQSVVSTLLSNRSERIDLKTINGLCAFFNVTPGDLFDYIPEDSAS